MNTTTMRERLVKFYNATPVYKSVLEFEDFIEQELKKEREEIVEMIEKYLGLARFGNNDELNDSYEMAFEQIINIIKNRV